MAAPLTDYVGERGVLLVFADVNCPFAGQALSELPVTVAMFLQQSIPTVVINLEDPKGAVRRFYASKEIPAPIIYDTGKTTQLSWDVQSVPTLALIGADNQLIYKGPALWQNLAAAGEKAFNLRKGALGVGVVIQGTGLG